jgi:hypothetical protein
MIDYKNHKPAADKRRRNTWCRVIRADSFIFNLYRNNLRECKK